MSISSIGTYGMSAKNLYLAQKTAKKTAMDQANPSGNEEIAGKTAKEEFLAYARMNPAERLRAEFLKSKNLTEEDVAAMTPEEKLKLENEIKNYVKEKLKAQTNQQRGSVVNIVV